VGLREAAVIVLAFLVAGCAPIVPLAASSPPGSGHHIWLVGHGWHVGLAVERGQMPASRWPESRAFSEFTYVEIGWGDADFYPAASVSIGLALRAAFRSRGSVLFVAAFDAPVDRFFADSEIIEITLSVEGLEALAAFIHDAYAHDPTGRPIVLAPIPYGRGWFYQASGRYGLLDNSNTWTARALQAAGCPIDPARTATAGMLLAEARRFGRVIRGPAGETAPARAETPRCS